MECTDGFLQLQDLDRMETDGYMEVAGKVSAPPQAADNSNSWQSTGTMVQEYHSQSPPQQPHMVQQQQAPADQSLDMVFEMDGVDELPQSSQPHLMSHSDLDLLPDVPPVGIDLDSLHLHASPQHMQHLLASQPPAMQQRHQQQQAWGSPSWHSQRQPQQPMWMPVPAPPVQYSSSWSGGPHALPQPLPGNHTPGGAPSHQQQQFGSQPSAGHWGVQPPHPHHMHGQQLSASVPVTFSGGAHLAHSQPGFQQPLPLMYDFGAASQQSSHAPPSSVGPTPHSLARLDVPVAAAPQRRAHTAPPPRRASARLPARIDYSIFAGEQDTSDSEEEAELSEGSAHSTPAGTPRAGGRDGNSASPSDSGSPPMGQLLRHQGSGAMRPSSYTAGGSGRFDGGRLAATPPRGGAAALGTPKSLPAGSGFPKSRSGRTVRPSGRSLRDSSPEAAVAAGGRDRDRSAGASALLVRLGTGTLSKRKRLVQPPAALRDGADADFNQRRKQHNPWTREETEALVDGVEACGGAGHWQDIKRLGYPAIAARSAVDLKDKWRNLLRIAELPPELAAARVDKKREAPSLEILDRVRALTAAGQQRAAAGEARAAAAASRPRARGRRT